MSDEVVTFCKTGAAFILAAALELLAEVEDSGEFVTDAVKNDAEVMRSLINEWIEVADDDDQGTSVVRNDFFWGPS